MNHLWTLCVAVRYTLDGASSNLFGFVCTSSSSISSRSSGSAIATASFYRHLITPSNNVQLLAPQLSSGSQACQHACLVSLDFLSVQAMLRYRSPLLTTLQLIFYIVPMLFGFFEETQWLTVKFADGFVDHLVCTGFTLDSF